MRWQAGARWVVAVAGLGTAVTLYVQTRERPAVPDRPAVSTPDDPEASMTSGQGRFDRFRNGEVEFSIEFDTTTEYADRNETAYTNARFRVGDGTFLRADRVVTTGTGPDDPEADTKLNGNVRMDTPEGASIQASEAVYNNSTGVAVMRGPLAFSRGTVSGTGTDGEYHRDTGVFHVLADARVVTAAGESGGRVEATARSMTFNGAGLALLFDQDARIAHETQTMTSDRATLYLAEQQDVFRVIELRGRAQVIPVEGQEAAVPEMQARDIDLAFHDGTQALERAVLVGGSSIVLAEGTARRSIEAADITLTTAPDGRTLTHLEGRERVVVRTPPDGDRAARTISAAALVATGTATDGLTSATFSGGVRFEETTPAARGAAPVTRTGTSRTLTMQLGGDLDAVEGARFQDDVTFTEGDVRGDADIGDYAAAEGRLTLRPASRPSKLPHVTSGRVTVDAREMIDVDLETQDLHARGDVKTVNTADTTAARADDSAGLFNTHDAMLGFASEFWYDGDGRQARYRGSDATRARLSQGETEVVAQSIELSEETGDLTGSGRVEATFLMTDAGAAAAPVTYRVQSDSLEYRDTARTATYVGAPVTLTGPDGVTRGLTVVMTLAAGGGRLERLEARADVHVTLADHREALADSLLYDADLDRYTLRGQPVLLRVEADTPGTCSLWRARVAHFTTGGGSPVFPDADNPGGANRRGVPCTAPLQK